MAYNMSLHKGLYPDEPGYREFTGFERETNIPGKTTNLFEVIDPNRFHKKLLENRILNISREKGAYTYTDLKIRNDIEMTKNQKYFQPKKWNVEKLLYNYDCLFHLWTNARETDNKLIKLLRDHIKNLYRLYNVDPRHRVTK